MSGLDFRSAGDELGTVALRPARAAGPDKDKGPKRDDRDTGTTVADPQQDSKVRLKKPKQWKVLLHNDNYTTRDFVVYVLQTVFAKPEPQAVQIMMHVHNNGTGVAGIYTYEVAETKLESTISLARQNEYPLMASMEPAEGNDGDKD